MRIAIATVQVPFTRGGAEIHAQALRDQLAGRGHEVDIVTVPFKWYPPRQILDCMLGARLVDLTEVNGDRVDLMIAMKFPAYYIPHPNKVLWLLHQHRQAYDLFGTELSDLWQSDEGRNMALEIRRWDCEFLPQFSRRFTNSKNVADRLRRFNGIESSPLYVPLSNPDIYRCGEFRDYVFYPGRFDSIKRQHLLVEAIENVPPPLQVVLIGDTGSAYGRTLLAQLESRPGLRERVRVLGLVSEDEKLDLYANCSAVYNGVYDEDYGYVTIEGFYSGKPVITHTDSGGPCEFVVDGSNGWIVPPNPAALAGCLTQIAARKAPVAEMGARARACVERANLSWDHVVQSLVS